MMNGLLMTSASDVKLAAPGAGLPALELFIARRMFASKRRSMSRDDVVSLFKQERAKIQALIDENDAAKFGQQVLIKRLRGLEDSSRNWSVWMTLEHLRICNEVFMQVIIGLTEGRVPEKAASTADVKPSPKVGPDVLEAYEKGCDAMLEEVGKLDDLKTSACYAHPWFGPLDAEAWHTLSAIHMGIHRRQIGKIVDALRR